MKLAEACVQLGKTDKNKMDKALDALARAHEARAESLPVLHKYGDLRMQRREWKDALTLYEAILRDQRQTLPPSEAAEIAMQIGGLPPRARKPGARVRGVPGSQGASIRRTARRWTRWRRRTRRRATGRRGCEERRALAAVAEPEEKPGLEEEIGDAYAEKLSDAERAEACYRAALELEPGGARRCTSC